MAIEARRVLGFALTAGLLGCGGSNATAPAPLPGEYFDLGRVRIPNASDIGEARTLVGVATFIGAAVRGPFGAESECVVDFGDGSPPATAHVRLPTPIIPYDDWSWPVCGGMHAYPAPGRYEVGITASMGRDTRSVHDPITVTSLTGTWVGQPAFVTEPVVLELVQVDATLTGTARWQGKVSRLSGTISYHRENGPTPSPGTYWRQPFHLDFAVEPFPRTAGGAPAGRYLQQTDRPFEILWPVVSWATSVRLDREPGP